MHDRNKTEAVESFVDFIDVEDKTVKKINDWMILKVLESGIDILNCRGPSAVMAGYWLS